MLERHLKSRFLEAVRSFPAVILTGARQTGKTTLCRELLGNTHRYVSLEDPDVRRWVLSDPRAFLESHPPPVILDEIQYAPEIPSYLQGKIDQNRERCGQFILTGSQNFLLMEQVSQSLAGRAAVLSLYPMSVAEVDGPAAAPRSSLAAVAEWILRGGYPELRVRPDLDRNLWVGSYIRLYLERDVRQVINVADLDTFERFLRLTAARTGTLLNLSDLARDAGVSPTTAGRWLSVLQESYQVILVRPFHRNLSKRLVKTPRLYFLDTAIASYLMGIHSPEPLIQGPSWGPLFETACMAELIKHLALSTTPASVSFFRTATGLEVDLVLERGPRLEAVEIKAGKTPSPGWTEPLRQFSALIPEVESLSVRAPVEKESVLSDGITLRPWDRW